MTVYYYPANALGGGKYERHDGGSDGYGNILDPLDDAIGKSAGRVFGPGFSKELPDVARTNRGALFDDCPDTQLTFEDVAD